MVHAGVVPQWDLALTLALAGEVEDLLRSPDLGDFLQVMYGNEPARWSDALAGDDRLRFVVNVLTRIRFVRRRRHARLRDQGRRRRRAAGLPAVVRCARPAHRAACRSPSATGRRSAWSTAPTCSALDTGCVWGGQLTAVRVDGGRREVIQVACEQAQRPG